MCKLDTKTVLLKFVFIQLNKGEVKCWVAFSVGGECVCGQKYEVFKNRLDITRWHLLTLKIIYIFFTKEQFPR